MRLARVVGSPLFIIMAIQGIPGKVIAKITKALGLQTAVDKSTYDLMNTIQPIVDSEPRPYVNAIFQKFTTAGTMTTLPTDKDFFLTGLQLTKAKLAAETGTSCNIRVFLESGEQIDLLVIGGHTLIAENTSVTLNLTVPIKLLRGSAISTVGPDISVVSATVFGYFEEGI